MPSPTRNLSFALIALLLALAPVSCGDDSGSTATSSSAGNGGTAATTATGGNGGAASNVGGAGGASSSGGSGGGPAVCPAGLLFEYTSSESRVDYGSTGLNHGAKRPRGPRVAVELYNCDSECRLCELRGPVRSTVVGTERRCMNRAEEMCENDAECTAFGGPMDQQRCLFPFSRAPLNAPAPICITHFWIPVSDPFPIQGNFDLFTGELVLNRSSNAGGQTPSHCQQCADDASPFDGKKDGVCSASGAPCDVDFISLDANLPFASSLDCGLLDGSGTPVRPQVYFPEGDTRRTSNNRSISVGSHSPRCGAQGFENTPCMCGVCEGNDLMPCFRDSDCPGTDACTAGSFPTRPNICLDACMCDAAGDCECTNAFTMSTAPCFPETTVALPGRNQKIGSLYSVVVSGLACFPTTTDPMIDQGVGLPGPLRLRDSFRITTLDATALMP